MRLQRLVFVILVCMLLCVSMGCSNDSDTSGQFDDGYYNEKFVDGPTDYQWYSSTMVEETENNIYLVVEGCTPGYSLACFDKETKRAVLLCNQVECTHDTVECDANLNDIMPRFYFYNGYLYYFTYDDQGCYLERMEEDGGNRERIQKVWNERNVDCDVIMHRGSLYYRYVDKIYRLYLGDEITKQKEIGEVPLTGYIDTITARGDSVFWTYKVEDGEDVSVYRYNTITEKTDKILVLKQGFSVVLAPVLEDLIYFYEIDSGICSLQPSTGTKTILYEDAGKVGLDLRFAGERFYLTNWRAIAHDGATVNEILFFDNEFNVISNFEKELEKDSLQNHDGFYCATDQYQFFWEHWELFYMDMREETPQYRSTGLVGVDYDMGAREGYDTDVQ